MERVAMRRHPLDRTPFNSVVCGEDTIVIWPKGDRREVYVEFRRETTWWFDPHDGADADGNRGVPNGGIDEDEWTEEKVGVYDKNLDIHRMVPLYKCKAWFRDQITEALDAYLRRIEPEPPEEDDGPDPDRYYDESIDRRLEAR